ncbi:hypothetical protein [Curtobacterium sp. VKM Ac-2887]|uniref:hypothetical protein n=1 Tax=Curtobacterium sp. VKM Ac-2887 TaxID=2783819 RepID=UPI00188A4A80|nr:hypothetical protein [Curtobacterium sp. VKM Ac-2887]MBF4588426.1 hypothetical protein [Curtobacterium sp. VKM Ac-2887]
MTRTKIAATLLVVAGAGFLVAEAVAASAWTTPGYSYAANYISDLDVVPRDVVNG